MADLSFRKLLSVDSEDSAEDADAEEVQLQGFVPPLLVDTQRCTMVIIMPRNKNTGGAVDHHEVVEQPYAKAKRIFDMPNNLNSYQTLSKLEHIKQTEASMNMELYQHDIRHRFLEVVSTSGVEVDHFASLDSDETFLKLYLPLDGAVIAGMAEHLEYDMPLKDTFYAEVEPHGPYPGLKPLQNDEGRTVLAKTKFRVADKEKFVPFRSIDAIRLLEFWLDEWVSLDEMERQGVITCYFPCPSATQIDEIHKEALSPGMWITPTFRNASLKIRPYLGEQLAFYFKFVAHLAQSMILPGIVGIVFAIYNSVVGSQTIGYQRSVLCVLFSIWAATLLQLFARHTSRTKQYWGVEEQEVFEQPNPDWDPDNRGESCKIFVNLATVTYVVLYIGGITALLAWQYNLKNGSWLNSVSSLLLTFVIKGGNFLWTFIAPALVKLENHRLESEEEEKLSALLAGVKLFVANFPFFSHCFLTNTVQANCAPTFEEAAQMTWTGFNKSLLDKKRLKVLHAFSFRRSKHAVCIKGCVPLDYTTAEVWSETGCDLDVQANLTTFFAFAVAIEVAFLILPILLSYWEIHKEYRKLQSKDSDTEAASEDEKKTYSFLQWEAKKFPYAFGSWGGDKVNDFLDMAINYSIVACWGVLYPPMVTIASVALFVLLRLRIYRMLYVTRRPLPRASAGLGIWRIIFQCINVAAVACNVGLAATFFYPMRMSPYSTQLGFFLVLEHTILLLQATVKFLISESPTDVTSIKYYNDYVRKYVKKQRKPEIKSSSVDHVNVDLNPENIPSDSDSS